MAPMPIVALHATVLPLVLAIAAVLFDEVTPVGAVFAVIPIMVVAIIPVINSDLDTAVLGLGVCQDDSWNRESGD